jgi:hypothetical protein
LVEVIDVMTSIVVVIYLLGAVGMAALVSDSPIDRDQIPLIAVYGIAWPFVFVMMVLSCVVLLLAYLCVGAWRVTRTNPAPTIASRPH